MPLNRIAPTFSSIFGFNYNIAKPALIQNTTLTFLSHSQYKKGISRLVFFIYPAYSG